jgi:hypothetical protein
MPGAELDHGLILIGKDAKNRPDRFCEEATRQIANLMAGAVLLVLVLQLAQQRRSRSEGACADSGFAMTRSSFEVAVDTSGVIQPFEVANVG